MACEGGWGATSKTGDTVSQGSSQVKAQWFSEQGVQEPSPHASPAQGLHLPCGKQLALLPTSCCAFCGRTEPGASLLA